MNTCENRFRPCGPTCILEPRTLYCSSVWLGLTSGALKTQLGYFTTRIPNKEYFSVMVFLCVIKDFIVHEIEGRNIDKNSMRRQHCESQQSFRRAVQQKKVGYKIKSICIKELVWCKKKEKSNAVLTKFLNWFQHVAVGRNSAYHRKPDWHSADTVAGTARTVFPLTPGDQQRYPPTPGANKNTNPNTWTALVTFLPHKYNFAGMFCFCFSSSIY